MRRLEPHPLIAHLESAHAAGNAPVQVLRIEKRDLKGSSIWAGPYLAFVVADGRVAPGGFALADHADVGWAVGCLAYEWFMAHDVPTAPAFATRALFSVEDVALAQELKCWFRLDLANGRAVAKPIVQGLDATSPGDYCSVNDYLMTQPQYRKNARLALRLSALLVPENRCPDSVRELTLRGDAGQEVKYRVGADGTRKVVARTPTAGDGATLDEIIDIAEQQRRPPAAPPA